MWNQADARYSRENEGKWIYKSPLSDSWELEQEGVLYKLTLTPFGHVGLFPEHHKQWRELNDLVNLEECEVLNLFAYSGGGLL